MKTCNRCLESKPLDQFSNGAYRCHKCRSEANKLSVQEHREYTAEITANRAFNTYMAQWRIPA